MDRTDTAKWGVTLADVRLVDLPFIKRFSLAVRQESAPASEVLAALDASREVVLAAMQDEGAAGSAVRSRRAAPATRGRR